MNASDFEYDGQFLRDYGFVICVFNNEKNGLQIEDNYDNLSFSKISTFDGKRNTLINTKYESCVQKTFDICKNPKLYNNDMIVTEQEYKQLVRWLNRRGFYKFRFILNKEDQQEREECYYNASFNIQTIYIDGKLYGLRLTMESDKPFGYKDMIEQKFVFTETDIANETDKVFYDESDEIGYMYPDLTITCNANGILTLSNDLTNCSMTIVGCAANEVITINGSAQIITSSSPTHDIYSSFNWQFFKVGNTLTNRINHITCTLPACIVISGQKVVKES